MNLVPLESLCFVQIANTQGLGDKNASLPRNRKIIG